jgi:hypothetical protein
MATTINEEKELALIDGTKITVRPLKISLLRQFLKKFDEVSEVAEDNDKSMDVLLQCVQIAMKQYKPEIAEDLSALEENLDLPTVYKIIEEASGINLSESAVINTLK